MLQSRVGAFSADIRCLTIQVERIQRQSLQDDEHLGTNKTHCTSRQSAVYVVMYTACRIINLAEIKTQSTVVTIAKTVRQFLLFCIISFPEIIELNRE